MYIYMYMYSHVHTLEGALVSGKTWGRWWPWDVLLCEGSTDENPDGTPLNTPNFLAWIWGKMTPPPPPASFRGYGTCWMPFTCRDVCLGPPKISGSCCDKRKMTVSPSCTETKLAAHLCTWLLVPMVFVFLLENKTNAHKCIHCVH